MTDEMTERLPEPAIALERSLARRRELDAQLLTLEAYDRWGAKTPEDHERAEREARPLEVELQAITEALQKQVRAMQANDEGSEHVRRWAEAHVTLLDRFLAGLSEADRIQRQVADEERAGWQSVAAGRRAFVDENHFFVRHDAALYEMLFGFATSPRG